MGGDDPRGKRRPRRLPAGRRLPRRHARPPQRRAPGEPRDHDDDPAGRGLSRRQEKLAALVERAEAEQLLALQREAIACADAAPALDPLDAAEREDALGDRLEARGLADELRESTDRISELVAAVKAYSYMDQGAMQEVDVHQGLESTLTILGHKLAEGSIEVLRDYGVEVPRISASGSELNQVWTNLLDNAIDALDGRGTLTLRTRPGPGAGGVRVEIADTGSGIAPEIADRIFDPFFTTKEVGAGTGLGLDTVRRGGSSSTATGGSSASSPKGRARARSPA